MMSFSSSGGCCEAADIKKSIAVNTLPFLIPRGTLTTVAGVKTTTRASGVLEEMGGEESIGECAGLSAFTCHLCFLM